MRICELREKEVVNVCDGERLGNICDVDFAFAIPQDSLSIL